MIDTFENCQLALFLREPPLDALKLWDKATGLSPTGFQTVGPGHTQAQGVVGNLDVVLAVQVSALRLDLFLSGHSEAGPPPGIDDPKAAVATGVETLSKIVDVLAVGRAAAVVEGHITASDLVDASAKLKTFVPDLPLLDGSEDVVYKAVVPRSSKTFPNRRLTQLCQWQAVQIQFLQLAPPQQPMAVGLKKFATQAHIDVFGVGMLVMDSTQAMAELREVSSRALEVLYGGYNELR